MSLKLASSIHSSSSGDAPTEISWDQTLPLAQMKRGLGWICNYLRKKKPHVAQVVIYIQK